MENFVPRDGRVNQTAIIDLLFARWRERGHTEDADNWPRHEKISRLRGAAA